MQYNLFIRELREAYHHFSRSSMDFGKIDKKRNSRIRIRRK
jgi:hypothetical protein